MDDALNLLRERGPAALWEKALGFLDQRSDFFLIFLLPRFELILSGQGIGDVSAKLRAVQGDNAKLEHS